MTDMLTGIRILSFNHFLMGPVGMQVLADLGADVIAVEPPGGSFQRKWGGANRRVDGETMLHLCGNRNKRNIAVDLKAPEGRSIIEKLIAKTDVICENFRPGVMDKLGFGYDGARKIKPDIIYAAASGFGSDGPYQNRPGQDLVIQALSGIANITGTEDQPPTAVGVSAADHHGAQILAMSVLAALFRRERTGKGCRIEVDLLSAALDLQIESLVCYANGEPVSQRAPTNIAGWYFPAPYGIYRVRDGHVAISLGSLEALGKALETPALGDFDDEQAYLRNGEIAALIQDTVAGMTVDDLKSRLEAQKLWYSQVNDYAAVMADPQVVHNGSFIRTESADGSPITLMAHPAKYDGERPGVRTPPQPIGAQTADILGELGYDSDAVDALAADGVVRVG